MNGQGNGICAGMLRSGLVVLLAAGLVVWLGAPLAAQTGCGCAPAVVADSSGWHAVRPQTAQPATYTYASDALRTTTSSHCVWRPSSAEACGPVDQNVQVTAWRPVSVYNAYSSAPVAPSACGCAVPVSSPGACSFGTPCYTGASFCSNYSDYSDYSNYSNYSNVALRPATCLVAYTGASACQPAYPYQNMVYRPAVPRFVLPGGNWTNRPLVVKPKVYVPGQPLRNMLRAILP